MNALILKAVINNNKWKKEGVAMFIKRKCLCVFFVVSLLFIIQPAFAENPASQDTPWEKFSLNAGYFISNTNTNLSLGSGLGVTVDVEELLGLDTTNNVFRIDAFWRFTDNRRHRLDFTWFSFRRDGNRTIGQDIEYEDDEGNIITIPAGSQVNTKFNLDIYKAAYSYSFFQDDRMDLAANIDAGKVFQREAPEVWRCRNCGYLYEGTSAPKLCPACAHPQAHFELLGENW